MLLLVLNPELDRLAHGDGIRFDGGLVSDMNCVAKLNEKWKDWYVFPILLKYEDGGHMAKGGAKGKKKGPPSKHKKGGR